MAHPEQKEVNDNQALLDEMDEMDVPYTHEEPDIAEDDQVDDENDEDIEEAEEETEDSDTEEDEDEETPGPTEDEDGPEELEEEAPAEAETEDQDPAPDADEVDDTEALRMQINELNQTILKLQNGTTQPQAKPEEVVETPPVETPQLQTTQATFAEDFDFFQGQDAEDVFDDPQKFNALLCNFANQVSQHTTQNNMLALPEIVRHQAEQQINVTNTVNAFYKENPDLNPIRATVAQVCNQVAAEHSDWSIEQVFNESATRTRKMLKMVKNHKTKSKVPASNLETDPNKTNIKSKTKSRKSKPKKSRLSKLQREIDEL